MRVSDEGGEELDHEVFRRGVSGDGGTGVCLAVATELAESLGGRLVLDDGPLTGFALRLPRLAEPATARQSLESRPDRRALRGSSGC